MTLGDVLATVDGILAACASLWAALVLCSLLFERRARCAAVELERHPWKCLGMGVLVGGAAAGIGLALVAQPNGAFKLVGWVFLALLVAQATLGASGFSILIADRINAKGPELSRFQSTARAAGIQIAAALIPMLGWLIGIVSLLASLGAAMLTVRRSERAADGAEARGSGPTVVASPTSSSYAVE